MNLWQEPEPVGWRRNQDHDTSDCHIDCEGSPDCDCVCHRWTIDVFIQDILKMKRHS